MPLHGKTGVAWGCAALSPEGVRDEVPETYAFHRLEQDHLAIHWNILQGDGGVVGEGYVEHVGGPGILIRFVNLTVRGIDAAGAVVSTVTGVPHRDTFQVGDQGLFRIAMLVTGRERSFRIRAEYWWEPFDEEEGSRSIFGR